MWRLPNAINLPVLDGLYIYVYTDVYHHLPPISGELGGFTIENSNADYTRLSDLRISGLLPHPWVGPMSLGCFWIKISSEEGLRV